MKEVATMQPACSPYLALNTSTNKKVNTNRERLWANSDIEKLYRGVIHINFKNLIFKIL